MNILKNKTHIFLMIFLLISLILSTSISNATTTEDIHLNQNNVQLDSSSASMVFFDSDEQFRMPTIAPVVVFIGGIVAGYIIDGVLIVATGYSGGELTAAAIKKILNYSKKHPWVRALIYSNGHVRPAGGGGGGAWLPHI
jgi:hypothetical protein